MSGQPDAERLPRVVLRRLNMTLKPLGLKICGTCQGHPQPLENFYRAGRDSTTSKCKACHNAASARRKAERMATDTEYRARVVEQRRRSQAKRREHRLEVTRAWERRRKAERLAKLLKGAKTA